MSMTLKDIRNISDTELRIKVAKLCGYHSFEGEKFLPSIEDEEPEYGLVCRDTMGYTVIAPDYPHDLNACHEFDKSLGNKEHHYEFWLKEATTFESPFNWMWNATARQKCEAFVMAMTMETK